MSSLVAPVEEYQPAGTEPVKCPPKGQGSYPELAQWVHDGIFQTQPLRLRDVLEWRENEMLDQGYQWLRPVAGALGGVSQWIDLFWDATVDKRMPMPVLNKGLDKRINESSRLGRPDYRPVARPRGTNPNLSQQIGARRLQSMLRHRLELMGWNSTGNDDLAYHMPLYGGAWTISYWDERWDDLTADPVQTGVECPRCKLRLATGQDDANGSWLTQCPRCQETGVEAPFQKFMPTLEEAMRERDPMGRPFGKLRPKGDWVLRVEPPDNIFLPNMGLDVKPHAIDDFTWVHIETMDWLHAHYPDKARNIRPDDPALLAAWHVIGGAPATLGMTLGFGLFKNMIRVKERHRGPRIVYRDGSDGQEAGWVLDHGRSVVIAANSVLRDEDYMIQSPQTGKLVPRARLDYAQWELRDGARRIQGLSMWRVMRDSQKISNEIIAQTQAVRRTCAVPIWLVARDQNFELAGLREGMPGYMAEIDVDPTAPGPEPKLINNMTIAPGVNTELKTVDDFMDRVAPPIEGGGTEPGVDAARAMNALKEEAGKKREPRIKRVKDMMVRQFKHGASLMQNLYDRPRECRYVNEDGEESWESFSGLELGTEVDLTVEPAMVDEDKQRMATQALLENQVISAQQSPQMQREITEIIGGPELKERLFEAEMLQENAAKREWSRFRDRNIPPVVDPILDNSAVHLDCHARDAESEWFREYTDRAQWDSALKLLGANMLEELQMIRNLDPMQLPPDIQMQLPPDLQGQIMFFWMRKLGERGFIQPPGMPGAPAGPDTQALKVVMEWQAHMAAHRLIEEKKQLAAQMGPMMAAPGGPQTPAGTQMHEEAIARGQTGGPGVPAEGVQKQVVQQRQARGIAKRGKEK